MADIILTAAANWSTCNGGGAPAAGDSIYLNGTFALTLDGANNATYTCALIRACVSAMDTTGKSGTIVLGAGTTTCILDCSIWAGAVTLLTIASGKHVTITGACTGSLATYSKYAIAVSAGGYLDSVGSARGGSATNAYGIYNNGTITTVIACTGGSVSGAYGIFNSGTITTVTACTGGSATNAYGILNSGTITTVTACTGGSVSGAYGITNNFTITTVIACTGGSVSGAYGIYNYSGTITTVIACTGGSVSGAYGIFNSGTITNAIGTAKGGTNATPANCITAYGIVNISLTEIPSITTIDNTGTCPAVGVIGLKLPAGARVGSYDAAGTAQQIAVPISTIAPAAKVIVGTDNYTGGDAGTYHEATVAEVQDGVMFGAGSALEGTLTGGGGGGRPEFRGENL